MSLPSQRGRRLRLGALAGLGALWGLATLLVACGQGHARHEPLWSHGERTPEVVAVDDMVFETPPPPFKDPDIFPCSECHDPEELPPDPTRRELKMAHDDIVLKHDEQHRWCLDCHDTQNRDRLRLANGTLVPFEQSFRLCGQCHGDKYRDWRAGVHGRRTGEWDGDKQYLLCVHCHDSHKPAFQPLKPLPPPKNPKEIR